ncbi:response regulator transcription factor [Winogradskyella sp. PG-2]|uniref:response regulator transcription factor n=1 Tax=Winogradskyella sp. PG-2 TaxID=754409 RepID=UPI0004588CBD|nr:response regulator transcription factor [Winogradskyella sp. PG-2]BAO76873.1 transcriptional regulator [Winogradskyella sp. PG-2]
MKKLDILIVDDSKLFSQGLALLLEQNTDEINSVRLASNYNEALKILTNDDISVILLDINFESSNYSGFTIAKKVKELYPKIKIIILTQQAKIDNYEILFNDLKVDGYLDKQLGVDDTLAALNAVSKGEKYVDKSIESMLQIGKWLDISNREKQIINLLTIGLTQKEIADRLFISSRTVETHIKNLTVKIGAKNSVHLVSIYSEYKNGNRESKQ